MVSYDYELFQLAQESGLNATVSLSLLGGLISKLQSCPLPKIVDSSIIDNIVSNCNNEKNNSENLKSILVALKDAIVSMGLAEDEYNNAMKDLENVEDEIWDFTTSSTSARPTIEDAEKMRQEITDLNERKEELEKELSYLKDLLGIKTEEDKKWYESLQVSTDKYYEDQNELRDSFNNIFTNKSTGGFISNVSDYLEDLSDFNKKKASTKAQVVTDVARGIYNVGEKIVDFAAQILAWGSSKMFENPELYTSPYLLALKNSGQIDNQKAIIENTTQTIVTKNVVDGLYNSFYNNLNIGRIINANSYVKYDDAFAEGVNKVSQSAGETGAIIAATAFGTPASGALMAAGFEGSIKGGEAVKKAYENGATFDEATLYSSIIGSTYGAMTYIGGKYLSNAFTKTGAYMPTFKLGDAVNVAFKTNAVLRSSLNGLAAGAIPIAESTAEWLTWGSEYHDVIYMYRNGWNDPNPDPSLFGIFEKNNTGKNVLISSALGFGLSTVGEITNSLQQGKVFKEAFMRDYGLSQEAVDALAENIHYTGAEEFYNKLGYYSGTAAGFHRGTSPGGEIYIKLEIDPDSYNNFKSVNSAMYHEATHDQGDLNIGFFGCRSLDETTTELLAYRTSGISPTHYNPKATMLLDKIEESIDPSKTLLKKLYTSYTTYNENLYLNKWGDPVYLGVWDYQKETLISKINEKVGDADVSRKILYQLTDALDTAISYDDCYDIKPLQAVLDELNLY